MYRVEQSKGLYELGGAVLLSLLLVDLVASALGTAIFIMLYRMTVPPVGLVVVVGGYVMLTLLTINAQRIVLKQLPMLPWNLWNVGAVGLSLALTAVIIAGGHIQQPGAGILSGVLPIALTRLAGFLYAKRWYTNLHGVSLVSTLATLTILTISAAIWLGF